MMPFNFINFKSLYEFSKIWLDTIRYNVFKKILDMLLVNPDQWPKRPLNVSIYQSAVTYYFLYPVKYHYVEWMFFSVVKIQNLCLELFKKTNYLSSTLCHFRQKAFLNSLKVSNTFCFQTVWRFFIKSSNSSAPKEMRY
jgi:hypothetical protein